MIITFLITLIAWVFFRANTVVHAFTYLKDMFSWSLFSVPEIFPNYIMYLVFGFLIVEWFGRHGEYAIEHIDNMKKPLRWSLYLILIVLMFRFAGEDQAFIYFQF